MENIDELIKRAKNNDEHAMEELLQKFKSKVTAISREYFLIGADFDDLIQEGMIGLYNAISVYDPNKNHNFSAFASLCIHRRLQNTVKNANRKKNAPLNSYLPIEYYGGVEREADDKFSRVIIVDDNSDFEKNCIDKEMNAIMISKVKDILTEQQIDLLKMFLQGATYLDMARAFNVSTKRIDNMLQAIKKKLRTIKGEI